MHCRMLLSVLVVLLALSPVLSRDDTNAPPGTKPGTPVRPNGPLPLTSGVLPPRYSSLQPLGPVPFPSAPRGGAALLKPGVVPADRTLVRPVALGVEIAAFEPYNRWTKHRGTVEESLVLAQTKTEDGTIKVYNGVVVRCDGFILTPKAIWDAQRAQRPLAIQVAQAEGEQLLGPVPVATRNLTTSRRVNEYQLVKVNDHHLPCLPVLDSSALAKGTPLQIVWAEPNGDGPGLKAVRLTATCGTPPTERGATFAGLELTPGQPTRAIPLGAVVIDTASGAAVGMITDSDLSHFTTLRYLGDICHYVGICPTRTAASKPSAERDAASPEMVRVPGGPVQLAAGQCDDFIKFYQTDVVCTPDFYCDRDLVTNKEWDAHVRGISGHPLPNGWGKENGNNHPTQHPDLPAAGMQAAEMMRYAFDRGKRLLTEVEWMRAAYAKDLSWFDRFREAVDKVSYALATLDRTYLEEIMTRVDEANSGNQVKIQTAKGTIYPIYDLVATYRNALRQQQVLAMRAVKVMPGMPHPIREIGDDKSDLGVYDVVLNMPEACQGPALNFRPAAKISPARMDPFLSWINYIVAFAEGSSSGASSSNAGNRYGTLATFNVEDSVAWHAMWLAQFGQRILLRGSGFTNETEMADASVQAGKPGARLDSYSLAGQVFIDLKPYAALGFRCGR